MNANSPGPSRSAEVHADWEFHLSLGRLFITSESHPDLQVALDAEASLALLEYLYQARDDLYDAVHPDESS